MSAYKSPEEYTFVKLVKDGPVGYVILNKPEQLNSWGTGEELEIGYAFDELNDDDKIKVVVFRGEGRAFSSGYNVGQLGTQYWDPGEDTKKRPTQRRRLRVDAHGRDIVRSIFNCRKVVIGEGKGYVLGGAFEFFLACDILICAEQTILGSPPARMVSASGMSTAFSLLRLGHALHAEMTLLGRYLHAEEMYERGVVNRVVPLEELEATVQAAADLALNIPADGVFIGKLATRLAYNVLGFEATTLGSNFGHTLQVQQVLDENDWNLFTERRDLGFKEAYQRRDARFQDAIKRFNPRGPII
jgi:enoyl-CoA hydratase